jgi:hypothetical protein
MTLILWCILLLRPFRALGHHGESAFTLCATVHDLLKHYGPQHKIWLGLWGSAQILVLHSWPSTEPASNHILIGSYVYRLSTSLCPCCSGCLSTVHANAAYPCAYGCVPTCTWPVSTCRWPCIHVKNLDMSKIKLCAGVHHAKFGYALWVTVQNLVKPQ